MSKNNSFWAFAFGIAAGAGTMYYLNSKEGKKLKKKVSKKMNKLSKTVQETVQEHSQNMAEKINEVSSNSKKSFEDGVKKAKHILEEKTAQLEEKINPKK